MLAGLHSTLPRLFPKGPLDVLRQVLVFALAYAGYRIARGAVDDRVGAAAAFEHARQLIGGERSLGVFVEPQGPAGAGSRPAIIDAASWMYLNAQFTVTIAALVYLYLAHN